jgi:sulfatase modifying factor 1
MKLKIIPYGALIAFIFFGCFLQREHYDVVRKVSNTKYETPPGTVWLRDNLFMDKMEIRNLDYLEFLFWTDRHEPAKTKSLLPDTLLWRAPLAYNEPYVEYYLRHPSYRDYPVIGVSYEQAVEYCKWRSDRVNEFIYLRDHKVENYRSDSIYPHPEVMQFRLPTKEEWEYAAAAGLNQDEYPYGYERLIDKNGIPVSYTTEYRNLYMLNKHFFSNQRLVEFTAGHQSDEDDIIAPVDAFTPNKYGIYNMTGNVSEIIADTLFKGLNYSTSLDGSTFKNNKEYVRTDSIVNRYDNRFTFRYQGPRVWLGFRCICKVLKEKKDY